MNYEELKNWFYSNEVPLMLDGTYNYYINVPETAELYIGMIDSEINTHGKPTELAQKYKRKLMQLFRELNDFSRWNMPRPYSNEYSREYYRYPFSDPREGKEYGYMTKKDWIGMVESLSIKL